MKRTTVHLSEELKGGLERAARISGLSEAHLIREGVQRVIELYGSPHPRIPLFESKDPTLAERADEPGGFWRDLILLDTSGVLAWIDRSQRHHSAVARAMERQEPPYLLSPFVLAELDYLVSTRVGQQAQNALLGEVARGAFRLVSFLADDVKQALDVLNRFADLQIGLADASIVVLAERHRASVLLSLDERHFRLLPGPGGRPFRLLPADFEGR